MKFHVRHITEYIYSDPVQLCHNAAWLLPRTTDEQSCHNSQLKITPTPAAFHEYKDYFGNRTVHFALQQSHTKLTIAADSDIEVNCDPEKYLKGNQHSWEYAREFCKSEGILPHADIIPCCYNSPMIKSDGRFRNYARPSFTTGRPFAEAVHDLMERIYTDFTYEPEVTDISTPLTEVLRQRHGVCQDFAHIAIACLRSMGLAARYVSGYIETLPPPGQPRLIGAAASHAWFAAYSPLAGWLAFDPTNNQPQGEQHITVAWGRDFSDVSPVKGVALGGGRHRVRVSVDVARQPEGPSCGWPEAGTQPQAFG